MSKYPDLQLIHRLTQKFLCSGFKSLSDDEAIDLINHSRERICDMERNLQESLAVLKKIEDGWDRGTDVRSRYAHEVRHAIHSEEKGE